MTSRALDRVSSRFDFGAAFGCGSRPLLVIPAKAGLQFFLWLFCLFFEQRARASAVLRPAGNFLCWCKESHQRNIFKSELAQEELIGRRKECAEFHGQFGFRGPTCTFADISVASKTTRRSAPFENALVNLRQKNRLCDSPAHFRFALRQTWACSDSKRHFFGDFLDSGHPALRPFGASSAVRAAPAAQCASKESYPLLRRRSGSSFFTRPRTSPLFPLKKRTERSVS